MFQISRPRHKATWSVGKNVSIKSVSVEDAESVQDAGPGWDDSMQEDLGQVKQIEAFGPGRCRLDGTWRLAKTLAPFFFFGYDDVCIYV